MLFASLYFPAFSWQGRPPGLDKEDPDFEERSQKRVHTKKSDGLNEDEKVLYDTKVEQLSSRGIRLHDLLQFWDELLEGQIMPSFDPQQSQTNDVVRQAVIPKARVGSGGVALAKLWAGDDAVVPQSMVTHNWSNTFAHLVAAIVADALEHDTYGNTAKHLMKKSGVTHVDVSAQCTEQSFIWHTGFVASLWTSMQASAMALGQSLQRTQMLGKLG